MKQILNALLLSVFVINFVESKLPSIIPTCPRNHPNIVQCVMDSVEKIRPNLNSGDFGGGFEVPALEPMFIDKIAMNRGADFQAIFSNLTVSGPGRFIVQNLKIDVENLAFDFVVKLPELNYTGKYTLKMKIALINLTGRGKTEGSLRNSKAQVKVRGYTEIVDGVEYVRFHRIQTKIKIGSGQFYLHQLFNGDATLEQLGNQVINENSKIFLDEIIPGLEKSLSERFTGIVNNIMKSVTLDEMFPPGN